MLNRKLSLKDKYRESLSNKEIEEEIKKINTPNKKVVNKSKTNE